MEIYRKPTPAKIIYNMNLTDYSVYFTSANMVENSYIEIVLDDEIKNGNYTVELYYTMTKYEEFDDLVVYLEDFGNYYAK